ncbi:hypothetical protein [Nocardioides donggukensis]|uniref:Uncharacterized protein n=1 Tax=Nocardioides donggukensis TaxID=2774019 RepID=A0A927K2I6_9ACTN|nr:hypothetical protein [Nocardioides donggukensis]MBD8868627.1 hypothetical protein [Nocardioides donggukensis]
MRRTATLVAAVAGAAALTLGGAVSAAPPDTQLSGALFTTDVTGVPVNLNHYADKRDVYLNGGPGINAPDSAAGLPAGIYTFMVTDPSGKTLLSSDDISCRQVEVGADGVFGSVAPSGACAHSTGTDGEDGGTTVQLFPYDDTPNNGGVYKVWITLTNDLACDSRAAKHCFLPSESKTDNFKVRAQNIVEIDARFYVHGSSTPIDGMAAVWTDTLGASNVKYSEWNPAILAFHEAHVEAAEQGRHQITIHDQVGCTIESVRGPDGEDYLPVDGTVVVPVFVKNHKAGDRTYFVDVQCVE